MSSTTTTSRKDDRTTRARIRDAAIQCFGELGFADTTARKVAAAAGVSPGSVIHHYQSMEGLREACDQHILALIREQKTRAMRTGPRLDVLEALREGTAPHVMEYLSRILIEDSSSVTQLVDGLVSDAKSYLADGVASGMLQPSSDEHSRAVLLTLWNLGSLVMHRHIKRLLGVDLIDPEFASSPSIQNYLVPVMEIYGTGIFTDEFVRTAQSSLSAGASEQTPEHSDVKGNA